jgi:hypothetical protein
MRRRRVRNEGYRMGRKGQDGIREKGEGKWDGRKEGSTPRFSPTPPV